MGTKKKLLFVFNPFSGKAQIKNQLLDIVDVMVKADYEVTIYPTQAQGDAIHKIETEAGDYDLVVCSGGDGTLDEVVTGMMHREKKVPLGYIAAGSTNDFATSLGIPKNMVKAAETAVAGRGFPCDIGAFNGDFFVYVAAFGLFTEVSYKTSQEWKNVLGHAAYILEGAKCLHDIPSFLMQVEYDNVRLQDEFIYGMISNSTSVGGILTLDPKQVDMGDGLFEILLVRAPENLGEIHECIQALQSQKYNCAMLTFRSAQKVRIFADPEMPWTLDGEKEDGHEMVEVENLHHAIRLMQKKDEDA